MVFTHVTDCMTGLIKVVVYHYVIIRMLNDIHYANELCASLKLLTKNKKLASIFLDSCS